MNPKVQFALYLAVIVFLVVLSAFFSCADMVYSVASPKRLERKGTKAALKAAKLIREYDRTIITILFANNLVNILASSLGAALTRIDLPLFAQNREVAAVVVEAIILVTIIIFGEIFPKVIGKAYSFRLSMLFYKPVVFFQFLFYPIVESSSFVAHFLSRPFLANQKESGGAPSEDELAAAVDLIEEEGLIDEDESEMLYSALEFKDTRAYEIMTPRVKIEAFEISENLRIKVESSSFQHSRIPVYKKSLDNMMGYLSLKQVQKAMLRNAKIDVRDLILPLESVPRTMEISSILALMKKTKRHIVLVRDEYGGTEGIVTMEDILEELVGEMWDESEVISEDIAKTKKRNVYKVKGSTHIEEFFAHFQITKEPSEDYETLSGLLSDRLGRFAKEGDVIHIEKVDILVTKATDYVVEETLVTFHPRRKIKEED